MASSPEASLLAMPKAQRDELLERLEDLPSHLAHQDELEQAFSQAFESWYTGGAQRGSACFGNVWIVVGASVANLTDVMGQFVNAIADKDSLEQHDSRFSEALTHRGLPIRLLQWSSRPPVEELEKRLQQQLGYGFDIHGSEREIVVIPCLEQCFLRSVEGLDGVDYLREHLLSASSRFLILGMGRVSWRYLQTIYRLESYSSQVTHLSQLSDQQLSKWLNPIYTQLNIQFKSPSLQSQLTTDEPNWREKYFECLAKESEGIDSVAAQLFLDSLQTNEREEIEVARPQKSDLPELEGEDVYLLYSLLLHRMLTEQELALSLGVMPQQLKARIQVLRRSGVVEKQGDELHLNPVYYPAVVTRLEGDNFLV